MVLVCPCGAPGQLTAARGSNEYAMDWLTTQKAHVDRTGAQGCNGTVSKKTGTPAPSNQLGTLLMKPPSLRLSAGLRPLSPERFAYDTIKEAIVSGELEPGVVRLQTQIAERLGICSLWDNSDRYGARTRFGQVPGLAERSHQEHQRILGAIEARQVEAAAPLMEAHKTRACIELLQLA